jgi:long-chain acyl-CoA synthetase
MLTGTAEIVSHWSRWEGAIECAYTGRTWSAKELRHLCALVTEKLFQAGLREGDSVALVLSNTVAFPVTLISLLELAGNPFLVYAAAQEAEVSRVVREFGIPWAVHDFVEGVSRLSKEAYRNAARISVGGVSVSILSTTEPARHRAFPLPAHGVVLHPTSGTYGRSEYCVRNQEVAVAEGRNYVDTIDLYRGCRIIVTTPLSHAFAYGFGLISSILSDSTLVLDTAFNPKRILRREKEEPSDILAIVPPMAKTLVHIGGSDPSRRMAKAVFYAGAPCDDELARQLETTFDTKLFAVYGTTETGAITSSYRGDVQKLPAVGMPLKNVEVEIRNRGRYAGLGDGVGEIYVKSTSMMQGYVKDMSKAEPIDYWSTGDIGFADEHGNVTIVGRIKDVINLGGMKVDPFEVEKTLLAHPGVKDAAVYPGVKRGGDEFVQAAIQTQEGGIHLPELRTHCLKLLTAYKVPGVFHVVDEIPRTPSGKCLKMRCPGFPERLVAR